ncbi:outer membrane protein assembly factor BamC [Pseudaeromonas sp. ZJS20]|uniref:outer membrane protein assembly factor BamC n=1 Tax=Pseudaeromonas aegiceratis TaxID=3153928 RepID=UPI00390C53CB
MLAGCGSMAERKQANRDFDYRDVKLSPAPFKVPQNLTAPVISSDYAIPSLKAEAANGAVGPQVDVRPPAQLLNIVPGSRAEAGKQDVTMWYTARAVDQKIESEIWSMLFNFLASRGVAVANLDLQNRVLETDWFTSNSLIKQWDPKADEEFKLRQRYRFAIVNDASRHRAGLNVQLIAHEAYVDGDQDTTPLTDLERRRYCVRALNQVSLYMDQQLKARQQQVKQTGLGLRLGFDDNGQPAWIAQANFDTTWKRVLQVLPKLAFTVENSQHALGLIEVKYNDPAASYWSKQGLTPFQLDSGKYRVQLGQMEDKKTSITLLDEDKKLVNSAVISQIYITLSQALDPQAAQGGK